MSEKITRDGEEYRVIEEVAMETLGAMDQDPTWFHMPEGWVIDGDMATAKLATYSEDGETGPEKFKLTLAIEKSDEGAAEGTNDE